MRKKFFSLLIFSIWFFHCHAQSINTNKPSDPSLLKGLGTLSFKLNGKYYQANKDQTKCWTTANVPLAILWAKGEGLDISWQIQNMQGKGTYRIDKDSAGAINFTIGTKTYWIRKTDGSTYLNITISTIRDKYNVKLLSGSFEGVLEGKDGVKVKITEGRFTTEGI